MQPTEIAEPKVGIKLSPNFSVAKILFLASLLFVPVKDQSLLKF